MISAIPLMPMPPMPMKWTGPRSKGAGRRGIPPQLAEFQPAAKGAAEPRAMGLRGLRGTGVTQNGRAWLSDVGRKLIDELCFGIVVRRNVRRQKPGGDRLRADRRDEDRRSEPPDLKLRAFDTETFG